MELSLVGQGVPKDHLDTEAENIDQALGTFEVGRKRRKAQERRIS